MQRVETLLGLHNAVKLMYYWEKEEGEEEWRKREGRRERYKNGKGKILISQVTSKETLE